MINTVLNLLVKTLGPLLVERLVTALYKVLNDWIAEKYISDTTNQNTEHDTQRYYLMKAIRSAETNEERKNLSIVLAKFNRGKLPNSDSKTNK